ncbi:MAG: hypothetical protein ACOX7N_00055 [Lawsonibacter sp.]|jgi:hypothetical protein
MGDGNKRKLNQPNNDDLSQVKSLIGDASGDNFSLDDILAEYGSGRSEGRGAVPVARRERPADKASGSKHAVRQKAGAVAGVCPVPREDSPQKKETEFDADRHHPKLSRDRRGGEKVVAFPGGKKAAYTEEAEDWDALEEEPEGQTILEEGDEAGAESEEDRVIAFPEEESVLSAFLKDMGRKADDYADRMFEEDERTDPEEVRRLERLIPGTDQEEAAPQWDLGRLRRAPRPDPPPPDDPPQELARVYGRGLKGMRVRGMSLLVLTVLALVQLLVPAAGFVWLPPLDSHSTQCWIAVGLLGAGTLLSGDVLLSGLSRAFRGRVGMDTLSALACLFTLADGISLAVNGHLSGRLPYCAVVLAGLWLLLHGAYHKRCAQRLSCRTAAASAQPYRVTLDEGKWNGRDTYAKWSGTAEGFGSQIQQDDGAQRIFRRCCPVLLLADVILALLATVGVGRPEEVLWGLSALFTATSAFGGSLIYGRAFHKIARRLLQSGAALAGWPGMANSKRGNRVLITDTDLFPPGYVELNGFKVLGNFPMERVVAYTATLIRDSGSGLGKLFHDQLRALGGLMRNAERLCCYEGGGLSANIRGDQVLVGSAAFMNLMEISLPPGLNVKNAVFCAINGELAGIFALTYTLPDTVFPSLEELMREKVGPVLATRDFNLIPAMLHQRFKLAADKMDFPPVERRRELSDQGQSHSEVLTALLCREGLYPFAEAVTAAKRLRWCTRLGAILCCVASVLGLCLAAYLVAVVAYGSLSPLNLMVYMVTWLVPVWLLTDWVHRY